MAPAATGAVTVIRVTTASDGDSSQWPQRGLRKDDPSPYLTRIASKYSKFHEMQQDRQYVLDRLPNGYALFSKTRDNDPTHVDRYLYGHPNSYRFRSVEEFFEHFRNLQDTGSTSDCMCVACKKGTKRQKRPVNTVSRPTRPALPSHAHPAAKSHSRFRQNSNHAQTTSQAAPAGIPQRPLTPESDKADDEHTPDPLYLLTRRLKNIGILDVAIKEQDSFDWRISRKQIPTFISKLRDQPSFIPRVGELVLFVRNLQSSQIVCTEQETSRFVVWDEATHSVERLTTWEAGVITDVPTESLHTADLLVDESKEYSVNYAGFRIEPFPAVGSQDKHWSKRIANVPLRAIRPFELYREIMKGSKAREFHQTIQNALAAMASVSLFEKYHFRGQWPSATVYCRGIYIGAALITVGDTVKLLPGALQSDDQVWDVLLVTSIKLRLIHLDARENEDFDVAVDDELENQHHDCCIHIDGIGFTRDQARAWGMGKLPISIDDRVLPDCIKGYGDWYHKHDPTRRWKVPFTRILGRCPELRAMESWFYPMAEAAKKGLSGFQAVNTAETQASLSSPQARVGHLNKGLRGLTQARDFSTKRDSRMDSKRGKTWLWAEDRIEQLDLHEVKGQVVTRFDHGKLTRDVRKWRRGLHLREKGAGHKPKGPYGSSTLPINTARPGGSMMAASAVGNAVDEADTGSIESSEMEGVEMDAGPDGILEGRPSEPPANIKQEATIDPQDVVYEDEGEGSSEVASEED